MGSATKHALSELTRRIERAQAATIQDAAQLFGAVHEIIGSQHLRTALCRPGGQPQAKRDLVAAVFGTQLTSVCRDLVETASLLRWSNEREFVTGLQEIAIRATSAFTGDHDRIGRELTFFLDTLDSSHELELELGSRLTPQSVKAELVERLLSIRVSRPTMLIIRNLVTHPFGRRIRRLVRWALDVVADQEQRSVATVTVARPLDNKTLNRLETSISKRWGRDITVNQVVDPNVLGGVRVQVGDDVIDDTALARLQNLRRQLA